MVGTSEEPVDGPIYNIRGEKVALGPIRRDLIPLYQRWINDFATVRNLGQIPQPLTLEQESIWYERASTDESIANFTIYELTAGQPIGTTSLTDINHYHSVATFGIFIGDEAMRGKGYGTETTQLMLDYGFTALNLRNITLTVYSYNLAGRRAYEKAGFKEIGRRRQSHLMGRRYWDMIYMDCLAEEFESPVLRRIFSVGDPAS